jgi:hypothetical protein
MDKKEKYLSSLMEVAYGWVLASCILHTLEKPDFFNISTLLSMVVIVWVGVHNSISE